MMLIRRLVALLLGLMVPVMIADNVLLAQDNARTIREVRIPRLEEIPPIESFLAMSQSDVPRCMAQAPGEFIQREPSDGEVSTQRTEVYLAYDKSALVVVFVAFDSRPDLLRARLAKRDQLGFDDTVHILLDTFSDRRRAYSFACNALGVQYDALWTEGSGFESSFDTLWEAEGRITDRGYVVRMEIPFKSIRFRNEDNQTWRFLLNRTIPRANEESFWPPITPRIASVLDQTAILSGIQGIESGGNMTFIPSSRVISEHSHATSSPASGLEAQFELGLDAKAVFKESLVLDLTANPDFSNVESDAPQLTTTSRFEAIYPEKRPFFLENGNLYNTPISLLWTRRIVDPEVGLRLTGRLSRRAFGILLTRDQGRNPSGTASVSGAANIGVLRVSQDIGDLSVLGVLASDRSTADKVNRVVSADARLVLSDNWIAMGQSAFSYTRGASSPAQVGNATQVHLSRWGKEFGATFEYTGISPEFGTDLGYIERSAIRTTELRMRWTNYPGTDVLLCWEPGLMLSRTWDYSGIGLDHYLGGSFMLEYPRMTQFRVIAGIGEETLDFSSSLANSAPVSLPTTSIGIEGRSQPTESLGLDARFRIGSWINYYPVDGSPPTSADLTSGSVVIQLRPTSEFQVQLSRIYSRLVHPGSSSLVTLQRATRIRLNYQQSLRLGYRLILQNESIDANPERSSLEPRHGLNLDLLVSYVWNPWAVIYLGYGTVYRDQLAGDSTEPMHLDTLARAQSQFFLKVSYPFRP